MSEMTIGERIRIFSDLVKGSQDNPQAGQHAQTFFKREIMGLEDERLLGDTPPELSPTEQRYVTNSFANALSSTVQTLSGVEYQTIVSFEHLMGQIKDTGTRQTLEDIGRQFNIG